MDIIVTTNAIFRIDDIQGLFVSVNGVCVKIENHQIEQFLDGLRQNSPEDYLQLEWGIAYLDYLDLLSDIDDLINFEG